MHSMDRSERCKHLYHPILTSTIVNYVAKKHTSCSSHIKISLPINLPGLQVINATKISIDVSRRKNADQVFAVANSFV